MRISKTIVKYVSKLDGTHLLFIRLVVGWVFVVSGWGKFQHLEQVVSFFRDLGIPAPQLQAPFVAMVEVVGGVALMTGFGSRVASLFLSATMFVALITAKREEITGMTELFSIYEFLYIVMLFAVGVQGPGPYALDRFFLGKK